MSNFLAFDCGATSGRAVLATFEGGSFQMEEVYRFPSEMVERDGRLYWDVRAMYRHFVACLDELEAKFRLCTLVQQLLLTKGFQHCTSREFFPQLGAFENMILPFGVFGRKGNADDLSGGFTQFHRGFYAVFGGFLLELRQRR